MLNMTLHTALTRVYLQNPLGFIKLQITNQRIPLAGVDIQLVNDSHWQWRAMKRSGDGYWQPEVEPGFNLSASEPVNVRVYCCDGSGPKVETGLLPVNMLCAYQDPLCVRHTGTIQC